MRVHVVTMAWRSLWGMNPVVGVVVRVGLSGDFNDKITVIKEKYPASDAISSSTNWQKKIMILSP